MPLNIDYVYTDRARVLRREKGPRIEYETRINETYSEWFPGRIAPAYQASSEYGRNMRKEIERTHQFICRLTDVVGGPVQIEAKDRIEVQTGPPVGGVYSTTQRDSGIYEIVEEPFKPRNLVEELLWVLVLNKLEEF